MKPNKEDFVFENLQNQRLVRTNGQINGMSFCLRNVSNCQVYLKDFTSTVYILNCKDC